MTAAFELTRPDDLVNLTVRVENLRLDASDAEAPKLVVENPQAPAFLIFEFPPQTIAETAFFEARPEITPETRKPDTDPDAGKTTNDPLENAGNVKARVGHPSRLAFRVPAGLAVPFTIEGLLDWSKFDLNVSPIAAIGASPTPQQIAEAPEISAPMPTETAIELPYRLVISPTREVSWGHRRLPFTACGRTELWHTRLQLASLEGPRELSQTDRAPLRAIWSPDYGEGLTLDRDPDLGRTAMSPNDRRKIVILTSAFHGFEVESDFSIDVGLDGLRVPAALESIALPIRRTGPYVPKPFFADELMLSGLGGWLDSRGQWDPPHSAVPSPLRDFSAVSEILAKRTVRESMRIHRSASTIDPKLLGNLGLLIPKTPKPTTEQLDLSEWVHKAAQGRDHYVRIVYEGELLPFRHRAALIKVTERKFKPHNGIVAAYLFQRLFIVVRDPVKTFAASDRGMPFKRVELTTLVTPDIAPPSNELGTNNYFWVEVPTGATTQDRFRFHAVATDIEDSKVDFTIPMMFVSSSEIGLKRQSVAQAYNKSKSIGDFERRSASIPGQKVFFAKRDQPANNNTQLVTRSLNFAMDAAATAPTLLMAEVNIPQVQELLGTDALTKIRLLPNYVQKGLDGKTGVFAEVGDFDPTQAQTDAFLGFKPGTLGVTFSSDKAGGFATPNLGVSTLSRKLGPLAGKAADAQNGTFDPASFFQTGLAKLFGTFDLIDLLPSGSLENNAPTLQTRTEDIVGLAGGKRVIATLDWTPPELHNKDLGVAAFKKNWQGVSKLRIHGHIDKPVTAATGLAAAAQDTKFEFTGTLNAFQISVLKSITINFTEFTFTSKSGAKPDVGVRLDPQEPLHFEGDLAFVEELRNAIPPDLFGDGPSLDISPTGIRAGFAFALPPVSVGVFSLKDVNLGAGLTLPFLDGKPALDFNVSERQRPFLLAVGIFGGGGFFHLQLDTAGVRIVEAAFEFGAAASVDLGVASGGVHIMAGIYFKLERVDPGTDLAPTLSGYLRMGGYLSVLGLIKVSLEFNLSFTYDKGKAYGRATLTVNIEIAFFNTSVEVTVEKSFGGKSGDPTFGQLFNTPATWNEYALAFA